MRAESSTRSRIIIISQLRTKETGQKKNMSQNIGTWAIKQSSGHVRADSVMNSESLWLSL